MRDRDGQRRRHENHRKERQHLSERNVDAERVRAVVVRRQRHEEHRRAQQHDLTVTDGACAPERTEENPLARREQPRQGAGWRHVKARVGEDRQPERGNRDGDRQQTAGELRAKSENAEHRPEDQLRVFGQHQKDDRPAELEKRHVEPAPQIGSERAAAGVGVEERDDVGCRADRQQFPEGNAAMKPADDGFQNQRVPEEIDDRVRDHHRKECHVVRVA